MRTPVSLLSLAALAFTVVAPAVAQQGPPPSASRNPVNLQYMAPRDQGGINVFEQPKKEGVEYTGFALNWGAAFTQQFQGLTHENTAAPRVVSGVDQNLLKEIGNGFNNATANLYMGAQLAKGIRVQLTSYLSSRHHNETWVKDGFLQIDASPIDIAILNKLMEYTTVRFGHFEVNYGDAHFRRTDNGNSMMNPFVGNLIMDAFTTEVGGDLFVRLPSGVFAGFGMTNGEVRGNIQRPKDRGEAFMFKAGFDRQINDDLRLRLSASRRDQASAISNTLYSGDRAGSRYYLVLENSAATEAAQFTSGRLNPGFSDNGVSTMINPFLKYKGIEFFGTYELAEGRTAAETERREFTQLAGEVIYRFGANEKFFAGARNNTVDGRLAGFTEDVSITRNALGAGWFITPSLLMKAELVNQEYKDFPTTDIRNGGKFKGFMIEGVVVF
jgi:hypothetical protein